MDELDEEVFARNFAEAEACDGLRRAGPDVRNRDAGLRNVR